MSEATRSAAVPPGGSARRAAGSVRFHSSWAGYSPFGVEMTKQVMWANLDAPSLEVALHMENRTQILAGTGGEIMEAAAAFGQRER
jgi:hypothetical protein